MTPQETVERALAAARCDDCVVIADQGSAANLRWAANSLTTNGVSRSRQLTVIAISRGGDGTRAGVVSRAGVREDQVAGVVAAAEQASPRVRPSRRRSRCSARPTRRLSASRKGRSRDSRAGTTSRAAPASACSRRSPPRSPKRSRPPRRPGGSCTGTPITH